MSSWLGGIEARVGQGERPWTREENLLLEECFRQQALLDNAAFALGREPWEVVQRGDVVRRVLRPQHGRSWYRAIPRQELLERWHRILEAPSSYARDCR